MMANDSCTKFPFHYIKFFSAPKSIMSLFLVSIGKHINHEKNILCCFCFFHYFLKRFCPGENRYGGWSCHVSFKKHCGKRR